MSEADIPRGTRVMAVVRWAILVAVSAAAVVTVSAYLRDRERPTDDHRPSRFYCVMHPQIRSPDPGTCPICHMDLVPIPAEMLGAHRTDGGVPGTVPVTVTLDRRQRFDIRSVAATTRDLAPELRAPAVVEAPDTGRAEVHLRSAGFLERVLVRQTQVHVTRGQTLALVYSPAVYEAEQSMLAAAHLDAPDVLAAARRNVELLGLSPGDVANVLRSGSPMRDVPVRAPASGWVTRFDAVLGTYATPEQALYEITDLSHVWVVASVFDEDVVRLARGMPARFTLHETATIPSGPPSSDSISPSAVPSGIDVTIDAIEPHVDTETRTTRVRLVVANPEVALRPGAWGEVVFALPPVRALVVPADSVVDTGTTTYVFVEVGDGRYEPRPVVAGRVVGDEREIRDGLRAGERVVARGGFLVDSESRLRAALLEGGLR